MLIHDHLAFHNVAELPPAPGGGLHLARFPQKLWNAAEAPGGNITIRSSNGCEIRFVSDAPRIRLCLRVLSGFDYASFHLRGCQIVKMPGRLKEGRIRGAPARPPSGLLQAARFLRG